MILSTQNSHMCNRLGFIEGCRLLHRAGFDALDLSLFSMSSNNSPYLAENWREYCEENRKLCDAEGIYFNQAHAPFSFRWEDPTVYNEIAQPRVLRSIEIAAIFGVKTIVVHPFHNFEYLGHEKEAHDRNVEYYRSMIPYCREFGIKIAAENMWQREKKRKYICADVASPGKAFVELLDEIDSEWITGCLDLGHCGLTGEEPENAIRVLGHDRLTALHVHDNDYTNDHHTLPGLGTMNWNEICRALKDIDYSGEFTYEADSFYKNFQTDYLDNAARFMVETGRYLINKIEN